MGKKSRRNQAEAAKKRSRKGRRSRRKLGNDPLVWVGGVLAILLVLVVFNLWQSGTFARPVTPTRAEDSADLLPLAEQRRSLRGEHDMRLIPRQTPTPGPAPANSPVSLVDSPDWSHDFGHIPSRTDVAHIFAVQNRGTADLVITNLVTSCGCTTAELSSSIIPPGRRADLTVRFDPDFHETKGETVRLVWFATNDPTQPWVEFRISADVQS